MYAVIALRLEQGFENLHFWNFIVTVRYSLSDFYLEVLIKSCATRNPTDFREVRVLLPQAKLKTVGTMRC